MGFNSGLKGLISTSIHPERQLALGNNYSTFAAYWFVKGGNQFPNVKITVSVSLCNVFEKLLLGTICLSVVMKEKTKYFDM